MSESSISMHIGNVNTVTNSCNRHGDQEGEREQGQGSKRVRDQQLRAGGDSTAIGPATFADTNQLIGDAAAKKTKAKALCDPMTTVFKKETRRAKYLTDTTEWALDVAGENILHEYCNSPETLTRINLNEIRFQVELMARKHEGDALPHDIINTIACTIPHLRIPDEAEAAAVRQEPEVAHLRNMHVGIALLCIYKATDRARRWEDDSTERLAWRRFLTVLRDTQHQLSLVMLRCWERDPSFWDTGPGQKREPEACPPPHTEPAHYGLDTMKHTTMRIPIPQPDSPPRDLRPRPMARYVSARVAEDPREGRMANTFKPMRLDPGLLPWLSKPKADKSHRFSYPDPLGKNPGKADGKGYKEHGTADGGKNHGSTYEKGIKETGTTNGKDYLDEGFFRPDDDDISNYGDESGHHATAPDVELSDLALKEIGLRNARIRTKRPELYSEQRALSAYFRHRYPEDLMRGELVPIDATRDELDPYFLDKSGSRWRSISQLKKMPSPSPTNQPPQMLEKEGKCQEGPTGESAPKLSAHAERLLLTRERANKRADNASAKTYRIARKKNGHNWRKSTIARNPMAHGSPCASPTSPRELQTL